MTSAPSQSFLTLLTCMVTLCFCAITPAFPKSGRQVRLAAEAEPVHISRLNGYQQYWKTPMMIEG
ncbi:MAG: hypothetical protein ACAI35_12430, partial [Candidatus Methylacidiphilales bacterium]|nr:hypothetical protein [Candidatus Methylacidiphilales bacterium]